MKSLYKFSPIPTCVWKKVGKDFILTDLNDAARTQCFSNKMEVLGVKPDELYLEHSQFSETLAHCFTEKSFVEREISCSQISTGKTQMLLLKCGFMPPDMVLVHIEDISNRQSVILQAKDAWNRTFDLLPDMVAIIDREYRIVKMNKAMVKRLGLTSGELVGKSCHSCIHGTQIPISFCPHKRLMEDNQEHSIEFYEKHLGNYFLVTVSPIHNSEGEVVGSLHVTQDITDSKRTELELRNTNEVLNQERRMFLRGPVVIFKWQNQEGGPVEYVSPNVKDMMGYSSDEFLSGKTIYSNIISKDDWVRVCQELITYSQSGVVNYKHQPYRIIKKNGEPIWVVDYRIILRDETGKITHYLGYLIDITAQKHTGDVLRESEERFKIIYEYAPDCYYLRDVNGRFVDANQSAEKITGYKRAELIGKNYLDLKLLSEDQIFKATSLLAKNALGQPTGPEEFILNRKDGTHINVEISTVPVQIKGEILILGIARDTTERKKTEELLKQSEEKFRKIVELAPDSIVTVDLKGVITSCNSTFLERTGYSEGEIIGRNSSKLVNLLGQSIFKNRDFKKPILTKILSKSEKFPKFYEVPWINKNGSTQISEVHIGLMKKGRKVIGIQAIARDITERKRIEEQLIVSEEKFRNMVNLIPDGLVTLDLNGIIISCNRAFTKGAGMSNEEVVGKHFSKLPIIPEMDQPKFEKLFDSVKKEKPSRAIEYQWINQNKEIRLGEARIDYVTKDGKIVGIQGIVRDITERNKAQKERERLYYNWPKAKNWRHLDNSLVAWHMRLIIRCTLS